MKNFLNKLIIFNFIVFLIFTINSCGKKSMPIPENQSSNVTSKWILKALIIKIVIYSVNMFH